MADLWLRYPRVLYINERCILRLAPHQNRSNKTGRIFAYHLSYSSIGHSCIDNEC